MGNPRNPDNKRVSTALRLPLDLLDEAERDALRAVVRHWHHHLVIGREHDDMREWTDIDWADSSWTPAEADAIRRALDSTQENTTP